MNRIRYHGSDISCNVITIAGLDGFASVKKDEQITLALLMPEDNEDDLVIEIYDDHSHEEFVDGVTAFAKDHKNRTFIFSDAIFNSNGQRLAKFITKNKLGKLIPSPIILNPSTGNKVRHWMWVYNGKMLPHAKCECK